jgi:alginate O-acetyltransferase complex protein AlgI
LSLFSLLFLCFLACVAVLYFAVPKKYQWIILLAASYVFYAWSGIKYLAYLLFTTVTTYLFARWIQSVSDGFKNELSLLREKCGDDRKSLSSGKSELKKHCTKKKRKILAAGIVINFLVLAVVKYSPLFLMSFNHLFSALNVNTELDFLRIALPMGLSFYIFQSVGYMIDVYRGKVEADRNIFHYALFVSYFPQIIQGPIGRYNKLAGQFFEPHSFDYTRVKFGLQRMVWGFFKKLVIADRISIITSEVFGNYAAAGYGGFITFSAALLYGVQIYADFSGGMDLVCGVSQIFGIELAENFKRPYFAKSVSEFWQRWHITLGTWMKDYLFYPLALSKPFGRMSKKLRKLGSPYAAKVLPTCLASFIVFIIVGLWHGASWGYVAYGLYQAVFVSTATLFEPFYRKCRGFFKVKAERFSFRLFQMLRTLFIITIGRFLSATGSLMQASDLLKATFSQWNPWVLFDDTFYNLCSNCRNFYLILFTIAVLFLVDLLHEKGCHLRETIARQGIVFRWTLYIVGILSIFIFGIYGPGYDAAKFIYQGF